MPAYKLGKKPARHDARLPAFSTIRTHLPPPPANSNWYASISNVPMLGNDKWGCCVEASVCHVLMQQTAYTSPGHGLVATEAECLQIYHDVTGFDPTNADTDQGTYMMGPGGMIEHWIKTGVVVGGKLNKLTNARAVQTKNIVQLKQAIWLFGSVMMGATLTESDLDEPNWIRQTGQVVGGHEFLLVGYETHGQETMFKVETWDGLRTASQEWVTGAADEAVCILDDTFFDKNNLTPAGLARSVLTSDLSAFA